MGPMALLPLRRKACWGFFALKNPTASAGFEPANLGTKGQHATSRPPKPLTVALIKMAVALTQIYLHDIRHFERHIACYMRTKCSVPSGPAVHSHFLYYLRQVIYSLYFGTSLSLTIATWITGWRAAEGLGADSWPVSRWEHAQQYGHRWQRKITGM